MKIVFTGLFLMLLQISVAQDLQNKYYKNIDVDYGLFASLNSDQYENLVGNRINLHGAYYFPNNFGVKSGISFSKNLEGSYAYYSIPVLFTYKTVTYKSKEIYIEAESLAEFVFELILGIFPKQYEFYAGASLGYIDPDNNVSLVSINGGPWYKEGFEVKQRFASTLDFGVKGRYKIGKLGILLSPALSYLVTKNFKYKSEFNTNKEYNPQMFLSFTFGLSYDF